jgi:hypothetical protein
MLRTKFEQLVNVLRSVQIADRNLGGIPPVPR